MAKLKISDYSSTSAGANLNTDINSIDIDEGCAPSGINNAIRTLMAQLKDFQTGVSGDSLTLGGALSGTSATFSGNVTASAISGASMTLSGALSGTSATFSGNVTASAISGASMTLSGDLTVDTNTLYVDSANDRVGIGTSSPAQKLDVNGSIRLAGSSSGNITISAPSVAGTNTLTLPATTQTLATQNSLGVRNHIINGDFSIAQRGTSFTSSANNDDAYTLDRWYILSDGNDAIDVTQETSVVPTNELYAIALDVETANKKFGIAQIIEQKNCVGLIGNTVTLSFKAKVSSTTKLDNVKCAIVSWSGTADTVTSDIVSAWGAEGTDPTLIANATYENTPANLNVTTSYATYSVSAAIDTASTKNVIVFIWSDVTDTTAGDFLYVTDVQLEVGTEATPFEHRPYDMELARCQRYYSTSIELGYTITNFPSFGAGRPGATFFCSVASGNDLFGNLQLPVAMRAPPTFNIYSASHRTSGSVRDGTNGADTPVSNYSFSTGNNKSIVYMSGLSGTVSRPYNFHWTASAEL